MKTAASMSVKLSGAGAVREASAITASAKHPTPAKTITRSPTLTESTSGPISVTVPAPSKPGMKGRSGFI